MKYVSLQNDNTFNDYMKMITKIGRFEGGVVIITNIMYQIIAVIKPIEGSNQRIVNIVYLFFSCLCLLLLACSFTNNVRRSYNSMYSFWILLLFRNISRLLDLENTRKFVTQVEWDYIFNMQVMITNFIFCQVVSSYKQNLGKMMASVAYLIYVNYVMAY